VRSTGGRWASALQAAKTEAAASSCLQPRARVPVSDVDHPALPAACPSPPAQSFLVAHNEGRRYARLLEAGRCWCSFKRATARRVFRARPAGDVNTVVGASLRKLVCRCCQRADRYFDDLTGSSHLGRVLPDAGGRHLPGLYPRPSFPSSLRCELVPLPSTNIPDVGELPLNPVARFGSQIGQINPTTVPRHLWMIKVDTTGLESRLTGSSSPP